jgi:spore germination cell wall hydrolase CwlJ-like protein
VKTAIQVLVAFAACLAPALSAAAQSAGFPRIVLAGPSDETAPLAVSFAIPHYTMSLQDRETVAACLVLEAASQGTYGMRAVMAVIRNRARGLPELYAPTVLREKQFSAFNPITSGHESLWRAVQRAKRDRMWPNALAVVDDALADSWRDPTGGATHYTRSAETTKWTRTLAKTVTIGAHSFYR